MTNSTKAFRVFLMTKRNGKKHLFFYESVTNIMCIKCFLMKQLLIAVCKKNLHILL